MNPLAFLWNLAKNAAGNAVDPDTYRQVPGDVAKIPKVVGAALGAAWRKATGVFR